MHLPSLLNLSATVPGSRDLLVHCGCRTRCSRPACVGWMIAPAELLGKATMCKQFSDTYQHLCPGHGRAIPQGRPHARHAGPCAHKVYAERAQAMGDALRKELGDAIEFMQPQGGLFVWARLTGAGGKGGRRQRAGQARH